MSVKSWGNFFYNEKLDPKNMRDVDIVLLMNLIAKLHEDYEPKIRMHVQKLMTRRLVCEIAIEMQIDLTSFKHKYKNKPILGRGLLDMWNIIYKEIFGSVTGTKGEFEAKRRDIRTKLAKVKQSEMVNSKINNIGS